MKKRTIMVSDFGVEKEVEVNEKVYLTYNRPKWREEKQKTREKKYGVLYSTEVSAENGYEIASDFNLEDYVINEEARKALREVLSTLNEMEKEILLAKFDKEVTVRGLGEKYGMSKSNISKIQKKLYIYVEEQMKDFRD